MSTAAGQPVGTRGRLRVRKWTKGQGFRQVMDELALEEPLEIQVESRSVSVTMRTPGHDEDLAAGFLLTEGILKRPTDITAIRPHPRNAQRNVVNVFLQPNVIVDYKTLTRHVFVSSSCGLCGKASIDAVFQQFPRLRKGIPIDPEVWLSLPKQMAKQQETFARTGGLHGAALFDLSGKLLVLREDVGRHNAVDKVIGHALRHDWLPLSQAILLVSGRASFEIMQKALAAGIPAVGAVSAPSSLAVAFARRSGQSLVGFLREDRFNLYSGQKK